MATIFPPINQNLLWYLTLVVFGVAMTVGFVWAYRVWSDVKGEVAESSDDPDDLLAPLTEAFAAGQMSEEEYLRLRQSVRRVVSPGPDQTLPIRPKLDLPLSERPGGGGTSSAAFDPPPPETQA